MNILQYDLEKYDIGTIRDVVTYLEDRGFEIVAIPKDFDLLLDCDTYTLNLFRKKLEDAIRKKEIINNMQLKEKRKFDFLFFF